MAAGEDSMDRALVDRAVEAYGKAMAALDLLRLRLWEERNISLAQLRVLAVLRAQEPLTPGRLADVLLVSPSTVTGLTDRLVRQGLIARRDDPEDRRVIRLYLTEEGRRMIEEVGEAGRAYIREVMAVIPPERREATVHALEEFVRALRAVDRARLLEGTAPAR